MLGGVGLLRDPVIERCTGQDISAQFAVIVDRSLEQVGLTLRQCVQAVEYRLIRAGDGGSILTMRLAQCRDVERWQQCRFCGATFRIECCAQKVNRCGL
jgi:limonene-1,2-epoxide hydrolase